MLAPQKTGNTKKSVGRKLLLTLVLIVLAIAVLERLRGQWALKVWAREKSAAGEILDAKKFFPKPSTEAILFSDRLNQVITNIPQSLRQYSGQVSCFVSDEAGEWGRGSQQTNPKSYYKESWTNTWSDIDAAVNMAEPALRNLRRLMTNPPPGTPLDIVQGMKDNAPLNLLGIRIAAQTLQTSALRNLHSGDLQGAIEDLTALEGVVRIREDEPNLVPLMVRVAVLGITTDTLWDALQSKRWSEKDLSKLQQICERNRKIPAQVPKAAESERVAHLYAIERFRSHSYENWLERNVEGFLSFGVKRTEIEPAVAPAGLRQWFFHPLWSFAWADQEALLYLESNQKDLTALRNLVADRSLRRLESELATNHASFHTPHASWRFYLRLPLLDDLLPGWQPLQPGEYPYTRYTKAWSCTMENLTKNELAITAITIKRYELRHGSAPANLVDLVPEFLDKLPCDFMDGNPLRYRSANGRKLALYSIGRDFHDDGGISKAPSGTKNTKLISPWDGPDLVWP